MEIDSLRSLIKSCEVQDEKKLSSLEYRLRETGKYKDEIELFAKLIRVKAPEEIAGLEKEVEGL